MAGTKNARLTALDFNVLDNSGLEYNDMLPRGDGKEAQHQIDVSVRYRQMQHRVLVECT